MLCVAESLAHDVEIDGIYYNLDEINKTAEVTYKGDASYDYYDEYLGSVTIPETITYNSEIYSVTSIGGEAFRGCSGLTSVTIPNSVTSIGGGAFFDCSGLTKVNYLGTVDKWVEFNWDWDWDYSNSNPTYYAKDLYINNELLTDVKITSADSIKDYAFCDCQSIKSVEIGKSVRYVGISAFEGCPLTYLTIGLEVTEIGRSAFRGNKLEFIEIPDKVETIGECALLGGNVKSIKLGKSVKEIGPSTYDKSGMPPLYAPSYYWSLSEIIVSPENKVFSSYEGVLYDNNRTTLITCPPAKTECIIPERVEVIGEHSFHENYNLKCLTIPNSVTSIGRGAFYGCNGLTSVTIPNSVTSIGSGAFRACENLKTVYNCSSLDIVKGSTSNGDVARYADEVINACLVGDFIVNYEDQIIEYIGDTTVNKIEIPEFVTGIKADVFASCANIDTIVWNAINCADFTEITSPFKKSSIKIKSVIFGNDVEYIPAFLCSDMTLLTEISIPGKVNSIGENAFVGCSRLRYITSYPTLVPLAKESSFNSYSAYLYIPCDYYDYYYDSYFDDYSEYYDEDYYYYDEEGNRQYLDEMEEL